MKMRRIVRRGTTAVAIALVLTSARASGFEGVETTPVVHGFGACAPFAPKGELALARVDPGMRFDGGGGAKIDRAFAREKPIRGDRRSRSVEESRDLGVYEPLIVKYGDEFDVEPALVRAVIRAESAFDRTAVSPKGAGGLMQLTPQTARSYGVTDVHSAEENIRGGVEHLRFLLDRYRDDVRKALAAYNAGATPVDRHRGIPPIAETKKYVKRVLRYLREYRAGVR